jgi:hypothetical protein
MLDGYFRDRVVADVQNLKSLVRSIGNSRVWLEHVAYLFHILISDPVSSQEKHLEFLVVLEPN